MLNGKDGESSGEWGDYSKIFDVAEFGYREIRVERPLRLNFQVSEERLRRLSAERAFRVASKRVSRQAFIAALRTMPDTLFTNRDEFEKVLERGHEVGGV